MKRVYLRSAFAAAALCLAASQVQAALIDFEGLPTSGSGPLVLSNATFTSSTGDWILTGGPQPNSFCAYSTDCSGITTVDFNVGVYSLTFTSDSDNDGGLQSTVDVYVGGVFDSTVNVFYDGNPFGSDLIDLSSIGNITKLVLTSTDFLGVTWDNFSFSETPPPVVPIPGATWLFASAIAALGWLRRREKAV